MAYNFFWKIWLRLNKLTKDVDNDYMAEVSTGKKSLRNADIAQLIVKEGSEIKYDTLLSILNQSDRIVREQVQLGNSVLTGACQYTPRVLGAWIGASAKFDPAAHKVALNIIPSAEMRAALAEVGVEVLGVKESGAFIGLVTDTATGLTDGSITAGDDIRIEGDKLKIAPEGEETLGVFLVDANGVATHVTRRLTQNDPKTIIARVPDLHPGQYSLRITTRFSTGSTLLKEPRTVEYDKLLIVA
ncbi:MAG: DNA-binding domain-containing protein [Breznakibacter sp.]